MNGVFVELAAIVVLRNKEGEGLGQTGRRKRIGKCKECNKLTVSQNKLKTPVVRNKFVNLNTCNFFLTNNRREEHIMSSNVK